MQYLFLAEKLCANYGKSSLHNWPSSHLAASFQTRPTLAGPRPGLPNPEQSRRCRGQKVAAVLGPRQEADSAPSNTLKRYAALRSNIPHLKPISSLQAIRLSWVKAAVFANHHGRVHRGRRHQEGTTRGPGHGGDGGVTRLWKNLSAPGGRPFRAEQRQFKSKRACVWVANHGLGRWFGQNVFIATEHLVDSEHGSTCQTNKQLWQATARAEAHSGFHCSAAMFLCSRCLRVGVVALRGSTEERRTRSNCAETSSAENRVSQIVTLVAGWMNSQSQTPTFLDCRF